MSKNFKFSQIVQWWPPDLIRKESIILHKTIIPMVNLIYHIIVKLYTHNSTP